MKKYAMLSSLLILSACSTTPDKLRTSEPVFQMESTKSSEQFASCIADGWENIDYIIYSPVVSYRPSTAGFEVVQYVNGTLTHLADIESVQNGSKVEVYTEALDFGEDPSVSVVQKCGS